MKNALKIFLVALLLLIVGYFILGYVSSYIGYYGKWKYRVSSSDVRESIKRGVFVKELHYKIDSFADGLANFQPFIEKGYRFGRNSSEVTVPLYNSDYPYQLAFNYRPNDSITVMIRKEELKKFDSANSSWGYLKLPSLRDTIILVINGGDLGIIKVWN